MTPGVFKDIILVGLYGLCTRLPMRLKYPISNYVFYRIDCLGPPCITWVSFGLEATLKCSWCCQSLSHAGLSLGLAKSFQ